MIRPLCTALSIGYLCVACGWLTGEEQPRQLRLGVGLAEETQLDQTVVVVRTVEDASTGKALGLQPGDRLIEVAGQPITSLADMRTLIQNIKADTPVTAIVDRAGERVTLNATAIEPPRAAAMSARTKALTSEVEGLNAQLNKDRSLRLEEILTLLHQVEQDLPKMAADFKQQYPKGRFNISISIDIQSDVLADQHKSIEPAPTPAPQPPETLTTP